MCDGCPSCKGCAGQRVGEGVTHSQQVGLTRGELSARVKRLADVLSRHGINDPSWSAWLRAFKASKSTDLTNAAEELARYAERLGGAMSGRVQVSGAGLVRDVPPEVRQVEDALSGVINAIAPALPYGNVIKGAHDARRSIMYGDTPSKGQSQARQGPSAPLTAKVVSAQATTRAARRGDPTARQRIADTRARASRGDSEAIKQARILSAARADDSKRIDMLYRAGTGGTVGTRAQRFAKGR